MFNIITEIEHLIGNNLLFMPPFSYLSHLLHDTRVATGTCKPGNLEKHLEFGNPPGKHLEFQVFLKAPVRSQFYPGKWLKTWKIVNF